jgi:RsiW-degrading membrane proteinase PrsW (M82 family)
MSEDTHPEPKKLIALTFFSGIAFGFLAIAVEKTIGNIAAPLGIEELSVISLVVLAFTEEFMKFAAAYCAVGGSHVLDEPIDRMIYMIVAALGFATLENIGAITNIPYSQAGLIIAALQTDSLRFVGATLLHSLTAGVVGYHWALGVARGKVARGLMVGLALATVLHAFFNYLILNYGNIAYTALLLTIVGFFVLNDFEKLKRTKK